MPDVTLAVDLGPVGLKNPIVVASGTFGYAREMAGFLDLSRPAAIIPKTITLAPRPGNPPPRTVETSSGLLNAIGLDNDGLKAFQAKSLPYLRTLSTAIIANIAGKSIDEFVTLAAALDQEPGLAALELNISCPNVSGGVDFGVDPALAREVVRRVRAVCRLPIIAKLTPNVTDIVQVAQAAVDGGADAVSLINTLGGMAIDWRNRRPILANNTGGLSGPAIKPVALRMVAEVYRALRIPIVGIGGISSATDVLEFMVAGAAAVQVGTANFYDPRVAERLVEELPILLDREGIGAVRDLTGTLVWHPSRHG